MPSPRTPSPTPYDQERAYLIPKERPRDSRQPEGPPWQLWVIVVLVCVISGYWLALELYTPPPQYHCTPSGQHLAPEPGGPAEITAVGHRDLNASEQLSLDLVGLFATANSAIKVSSRPPLLLKSQVGAIASGVNEFNQHVSTCDQHNWRPCLTSLISGLLLTAASHHRAPIPAIRIVPFEDLIISIDQFDDTSTHPAHLFISNYREVVERDPSFGTARIGYIHYVNLGLRRHRLVIQPRSTGIGRRGDKNRSGDDNGSVSYEWTWVTTLLVINTDMKRFCFKQGGRYQ